MDLHSKGCQQFDGSLDNALWALIAGKNLRLRLCAVRS